jgi:cytochrome c oxidase subunit IV
LTPPAALLVFIGLMSVEGYYINGSRLLYFATIAAGG